MGASNTPALFAATNRLLVKTALETLRNGGRVVLVETAKFCHFWIYFKFNKTWQ